MSIPTIQEFKSIATTTMHEIQVWAREAFNLSSLPIKLTITERRHNFYGMAGIKRDKMERFEAFTIKLAAHDYINYPLKAVGEYASYNNVVGIGGFETTDTTLSIRTLVAHEMAHVIQFALRMDAINGISSGRPHPLVTDWKGATPIFGKTLGEYEGGHGSFFQAIYKRVRERFINDAVPRSAYTAPRVQFIIPDLFDEKMAKMPKSKLAGIKFFNGGRQLTVLGYNPKRNKLFDYVVEDAQGKVLRCKMSLIVQQSPEAKKLTETDPAVRAEFYAHCIAQQGKSQANMKSRQTKARRAVARSN